MFHALHLPVSPPCPAPPTLLLRHTAATSPSPKPLCPKNAVTVRLPAAGGAIVRFECPMPNARRRHAWEPHSATTRSCASPANGTRSQLVLQASTNCFGVALHFTSSLQRPRLSHSRWRRKSPPSGSGRSASKPIVPERASIAPLPGNAPPVCAKRGTPHPANIAVSCAFSQPSERHAKRNANAKRSPCPPSPPPPSAGPQHGQNETLRGRIGSGCWNAPWRSPAPRRATPDFRSSPNDRLAGERRFGSSALSRSRRRRREPK